MQELTSELSCLQIPNCNSLLIPNKPIFLLEKYLAVCLCQVNIFVTHWGSEKILKAFRAGEQTSACTQHFSISCFTSCEVLLFPAVHLNVLHCKNINPTILPCITNIFFHNCLIPGSGRSPGEGNSNPLQYLAWRISRTEDPGGLQSIGSHRVRHESCRLSTHVYLLM